MARRIGIKDRRHVVLDVAGGEQHARNSQNIGHAPGDERVKSVADDRRREFQETAFDFILWQAFHDAARDRLEFPHCIGIAATVAAHHDP